MAFQGPELGVGARGRCGVTWECAWHGGLERGMERVGCGLCCCGPVGEGSGLCGMVGWDVGMRWDGMLWLGVGGFEGSVRMVVRCGIQTSKVALPEQQVERKIRGKACDRHTTFLCSVTFLYCLCFCRTCMRGRDGWRYEWMDYPCIKTP